MVAHEPKSVHLLINENHLHISSTQINAGPQRNAGSLIKRRGRLFQFRPDKPSIYLNVAFIRGPAFIIEKIQYDMSLFIFSLFQPRCDLSALLQILCGVFSTQPPVYTRQPMAPPQPTEYNRPHQPGYPGASLSYPVGGAARMPMPGKFITVEIG